MTDANGTSSRLVPLSEIRLLLGISPELRSALETARGCSLDRETQTITIRGGPADGQRFRPDATGRFVRLLDPDPDRT